MVIVLMGYMGSGKSIISNKLSQILNFEHLDLDNYIEIKEDMSVSDIFKSKGEIYFRKKENEYLNEVITKENTVIALGGGTPCYGSNMNLILQSDNVISIYLKTSIKNLANRLITETSKRPLISHIETIDELSEYIGKHLFERSFYYNQSKILINTDEKSIDDIVEAILFQLL
ncbi:shikimate kinase [Ichthyenterobacterium magnum]|uniref:Shikimate kinase n=1 Tax=Ichthyenterobacterium magnum TaxID=1230530 RepID=A0A420DGF7_9FLAO|nr:shikimate kinase [Ichthyenterobacterium magnum]RKE92160.1 shikimate kinase [Ichthyenterobacterium magnum]